MCGIYGITKKDIQLIESYITTCWYRGPDGNDTWSDDHVTIYFQSHLKHHKANNHGSLTKAMCWFTMVKYSTIKN